MAKIFISYRREDSQWQTKAIYSKLAEIVPNPRENIFYDLDSMTLGRDFREKINTAVEQCDILLAMIGPGWLNARDEDTGERRLEDPNDFVRLEIAAALERDIPVVPVLLDGTKVPEQEKLPIDLIGLGYRHGLKVRAESFDADVAALIKGLGLGKKEASAPSPGSNAYWDEIKETVEVRNYENFITHFPDHPQTFEARIRARQLKEYAAVDKTSAGAIADFRKTKNETDPLFAALEAHTKREMDRAARGALETRKIRDRRATKRQGNALVAGLAVSSLVLIGILASSFGIGKWLSPAGDPSETGTELQQTSSESDEVDKFSVGSTFRDTLSDGSLGPEMVVVPSGSFVMGSPSSETGLSYRREDPQRTVTLSKPFAVGKFEVTWEDWESYINDETYEGARPADRGSDEGWGRGDRPVINVSWKDAKAYTTWLSEKTGHEYRLLSEAEWEYVARAGTTTPYSTGETISTTDANFSGDNYIRTTVPVGSYAANAFGLYDVHGNVWEWVEDCWNGSYTGAAKDGSAWLSGDCDRRVLRGGGWFSSPSGLRSAERFRKYTTVRDSTFGFRIARDLSD